VPISMAKEPGALATSGFRTLGQFVDHMLGRG
jgi:DNA repair protein RadA/Sms